MSVALTTPPPLRDGEVALVPVDARAAPLLVAASRDEAITRWTQVPAAMSMTDAALVTAGWADSSRAVRLMVCLGDGDPVGMVTVWVNEAAEAEVGYWLLEAARHRGVARRAVELVCTWALTRCELDRLQLATLAGNAASESVARACGFVAVGSVERVVQDAPRTLQLWERRAAGDGAAVPLRVQRTADRKGP